MYFGVYRCPEEMAMRANRVKEKMREEIGMKRGLRIGVLASR